MPVEAGNMNYTSVIVSGFVFLITVWWFVHGTRNYEGPKYYKEAAKQFADSGSAVMSELE